MFQTPRFPVTGTPSANRFRRPELLGRGGCGCGEILWRGGTPAAPPSGREGGGWSCGLAGKAGVICSGGGEGRDSCRPSLGTRGSWLVLWASWKSGSDLFRRWGGETRVSPLRWGEKKVVGDEGWREERECGGAARSSEFMDHLLVSMTPPILLISVFYDPFRRLRIEVRSSMDSAP